MKTGIRSIILVIVALGASYWFLAGKETNVSEAQVSESLALVEISIPSSLSSNAQVGRTVFEAKCASCHGENAVGHDGKGPPLVHVIYEPSHHGDESFQRAVVAGVRQHHWRFGDMPPVEGLTRGDVTMLVAYIRELQGTNGIR